METTAARRKRPAGNAAQRIAYGRSCQGHSPRVWLLDLILIMFIKPWASARARHEVLFTWHAAERTAVPGCGHRMLINM